MDTEKLTNLALGLNHESERARTAATNALAGLIERAERARRMMLREGGEPFTGDLEQIGELAAEAAREAGISVTAHSASETLYEGLLPAQEG